MNAEHRCHVTVIYSPSCGEDMTMLRKKKSIRAVAYPIDISAVRWLAALAFVLALLAIPY
jgi:hypothetical protein